MPRTCSKRSWSGEKIGKEREETKERGTILVARPETRQFALGAAEETAQRLLLSVQVTSRTGPVHSLRPSDMGSLFSPRCSETMGSILKNLGVINRPRKILPFLV